MRIERVKIKDWVNGNCEFKGCKYNTEGSCTHDDSDFIDDIFEMVNKNGIDNDIHFECNAIEVPDGVCGYCDHELSKSTEQFPYGDTTVPYTFYECKNKNC